ncbi:MAG: hypothetical protein K6V97_07755 [Actinomycetia bacterium]|nr:hypothetical protein [Actinomycetes bacterium]
MSFEGRGALAIWCDIPARYEAAFNAWYTHEHVPERVAVPGFRRARRYVAAGRHASQKYFTLYEVDSPAVLASAPYLERLERPTEATRRMVARFERNVRAVFRVAGSWGRGVGGWLLTAAVTGVGGGDPPDRTADAAGLLGWDEVVGVHLLEADPETARAKDRTAEGRIAAGEASAPSWVLLVETASGAALPRLEQALAEGRLPWRLPTPAGPAVGRYRLMYLLQPDGTSG